MNKFFNTVCAIRKDNASSQFMFTQLTDNLIFTLTIKPIRKRFKDVDGVTVEIHRISDIGEPAQFSE